WRGRGGRGSNPAGPDAARFLLGIADSAALASAQFAFARGILISMELGTRARSGSIGASLGRCALAVAACILFAIAKGAVAAELTPAQAALYTTVSIFPPSASSMTVCYGFVCRRRQILDFTAADRGALARILAAGQGSAVAERAAVQKAVIWFDRRM